MIEQVADATGETVSYSYRPSVFGAFREFGLTERGIDWAVGLRSGSIPFDRVRRLRVSYRPHSMQSHRFVTELWADGSPKLLISSSSWKSMMEQERLDGAYSSFVRELHRRISRANGATQFERGSNPLIYWLGILVFVGAGIGLAALIVRALQAGATSERGDRRCLPCVSISGRPAISFAGIDQAPIGRTRFQPTSCRGNRLAGAFL